MPFRVRRRSHRDGSRWASLPRCSGSCMALAAFPLGLFPFGRAFEASPHRTILCARGRTQHPNSRATALVSFSACSGLVLPGSVTRCAGVSRSPAHAHAPVSTGIPPAASTLPSPGRALAHPPGDRDSPSTGGETGLRRRSRVEGRACCRSSAHAGPCAAGCPAAPGWISRGTCAHRCAPPAGLDW